MADLVVTIGVAVAALLGALLYGRRERRKGRDDIVKEMIQQDRKNAAKVKEALDEVDTDGNAADRLRAKGRLRD